MGAWCDNTNPTVYEPLGITRRSRLTMSRKTQFSRTMSFVAAVLAVGLPLKASDHSDAPRTTELTRQDANLTDLHAFVSGGNLVLALSMNPAIPPSAGSYVFPSDLTFEINIDNHSAVSPEDPYQMGGTILDPSKVQEDITFRIRFGDDGQARVQMLVHGQRNGPMEMINFFTGLRDDPFIRGPRLDQPWRRRPADAPGGHALDRVRARP